ncbi:MAG: GGDEF domain-containing phosphodiesterase [Betaproteobacteria bacterium]
MSKPAGGHPVARSAAVLDYSAFRSRVQALTGEDASSPRLGVLLLNLDGMQIIDSTLGFDFGDRLLKDASERLLNALKSTDVVGEIGRGQFVCLLVNLASSAHAVLAANKLFSALSAPISVDGRTLHLSPCVGIAQSEGRHNADALLRAAAAAAHNARLRGEPYSDQQVVQDPLAMMQFDLQGDLKKAIENNDLFMCYQPQVDLRSGRIFSAEALLRWKHPVRGMIPPDKLVQVAERTGLITALTGWVFNTALRQCADYRALGLDLGVSINFSAANLRDAELVELVEQCIGLWDVPPERIMIELTETAVMDDQPSSLDALMRIKNLGVTLSMDDFGTGYSSMGRLRDLPLDELKIDMSFVRTMLAKPANERIVQSMIGIGKSLGLKVLAEGVEDVATRDRLRAMGCDFMQGYLVSKPLPLTEFVALVRNFMTARA